MNVDVIVIGTGQGGIPLARRLADAGRRVLIAERSQLGGTCVNYGCTPTKTMIASARAAHVARTCRRLGVEAGAVKVNLSAVVDRKEAIIREWQQHVVQRLQIDSDRLRLIRGHARFVAERQVEVEGQRYEAETVIIDVGARPAVPSIPGLQEVPWLDNHRIMELRELPTHLMVLGGGYIGCEFGQMFRRFGSDVTIVDGGPRLLGRDDPEISAELEKVFRAEGITLELSQQASNIARREGRISLQLSGREIRGSHLLVAVGRRPNTDDLGCDAGGIKLDKRGFIEVDDHYRTSAAGVYAIGDVTGGPQFTHTAWDDHRLLFNLLLGQGSRGRSSRVVPYTVFTDPQVAGVGINQSQAQSRGIEHEVASLPFSSVARAKETDETAGLIKVVLDPRTEQVLGASIIGAEAGELIHIFVTLMQAKASARAIVDAEYVHPTFAEGVQSAVMKLKQFALS
jgi:pyruvate/2-oxoglutarate dehydrogenase complex dihydrolipoamide dehydrogenase (E3) component